jgi:hypothetical protein
MSDYLYATNYGSVAMRKQRKGIFSLFRFLPDIALFIYLLLVIGRVFLPDRVSFSLVIVYGLLICITQLKYALDYHRKLLVTFGLFFLTAFFICGFRGEAYAKPAYLLAHLGLALMLIRYKMSPRPVQAILYSLLFLSGHCAGHRPECAAGRRQP